MEQYTELTIADIVRKLEDEDQQGNTTISKYVNFSMRENLEKIDAYLNSIHISGSKDASGRIKPFFNIVTAAANIWYRATDIDRKNIRVKADRASQYALAFIATILLQDWMRKASFGKFLNEWGRVLARYGSAVVKFVEQKGTLVSEVMPWNRLIIDPVDFENNVVVEKLWLTPAQLRAKKEYDQELVETLIGAKTTRETMDGQKKDTKADYIELFEVHGELPLSHITHEDKDDETYVQQMHVISYLGKKEGRGGEAKYDDFTLYAGRESKNPYMITHLIKEDGRSLAIGAVEHLFQTQWMVNHTTKSIKDQLDLASKLIFQTSDGNFIGQNVLTSIDNGDILTHSPGMPLTSIANRADIAALQSFGSQWKDNGREINGIAESMVTQAKSGTAWRQTQAELQEAHSLFELMTENKGLDIEQMLREYIIPHLKKKMDTADEISAILDEFQIKKLDTMYVPAKARKNVNDKIKKKILSITEEDIRKGDLVTSEVQNEMVASEEEAIQKSLNVLGNERFIKPSEVDDKTWKEVMKDLEWELDIDVTGENKDSQAILQTLTTVLQSIGSNPGILQDPNIKMVFNRILEETGALSPVEISTVENAPQPAPQPVPGEQPLQQLTQ